MESERIKSLYKQVSNFHKNEDINNDLPVMDKLLPVLRNYQKRAVKWMLRKEKEDEQIIIKGLDVRLPKGGILADEMGLGKTVEVLGCILHNPFVGDEKSDVKKVTLKRRHQLIDDIDQVEYRPKKRKLNSKSDVKIENEKKTPNSGINSSKYNALRRSYELALSQMSCSLSNRENTSQMELSCESRIRCFCNDNSSETLKLVECEDCKIWQHAKCLGVENGYGIGDVKCPQCWLKSPMISTKTTLIITPAAILNQWIQEINKHVDCSNFKYIVYNGIKNQSYMQPPTLASYDIVLTTYNVLCSELNYLQSENASRRMRHAKKYYSPTSPLMCINWWRICLDEAQMVEGYTSKTALMASQIVARHRWAVSGTPIQKSIQDLFGLVHFLHIHPYNDNSMWNKLQSNNEELFTFISNILWRSTKEEVHGELGVPPQSVLTHWLQFSPVEAYFYRTIHTECAAAFRQKLFRFSDLDIKLAHLDRRDFSSLMLPLLGVRQACAHPQVVRGKFVKLKHTMTMEELMSQMVVKARLDVDISMRQLVSSLHGIAGLHIIERCWSKAVEHYRLVLQLAAQYENMVKVDTLQMIHCLHNLSEVLEQHGADIPPTLRDSELKNEAKTLEANYLLRYSKKLVDTQEKLAKITATIAQMCEGYTLSYNGWWNDLLNSNVDEEELLNRIKTYLEDNEIPGQHKLSDRMTSLHYVLREVALWLAQADYMRQETLAALRKLDISTASDLIESALMCHLGTEGKRKKKVNKCNICTTETVLKKYEAHIFSINKRNLDETVDGKGSNDDEDHEEAEGEGKELKDVRMFKTNKESNWKPTQQELVLQVLSCYVKRTDSKMRDDGAKHLAILGNVRKEFKWIRAVWRTISDQVYATDELYMAKLRLRLPVFDDELDGKKKKKTDIFILQPHDVPLTMLQLQDEFQQAESNLKRTSGTLFYLQNLQKSGSTEQECPVCKEELNEKWSVLNCGHCCCFDCIPYLLKMGGNEIDCPLCRVKTPKNDVSYVVSRRQNEDTKPEVQGSYSTKVTAVLSELLSLIKSDSSVKVLIFSTWEKVLDIIRDALVQNDISFRRLQYGGEKFKTNLSQFKSEDVTALLLPLKHGSKGLNLTEATHLFFVEPILNPAEEQQAIGRIHRIGQTKPTFVHRFVVHNTIEERMLSSLETSAEEDWAKENITLRRLNDLFILKDDVPLHGTSENPIRIDQSDND